MIWNIKKTNPIKVKKYSQALNVSKLMAKILINRKKNIADSQTLLTNPKNFISDPKSIIGAEDAADKIIHYLTKENAQIWIFADYDVDGITSGYVMKHFLSKITKNNVYVYYPERKENYGLNMTFSEKLVEYKNQSNTDILVITVDNGTSAINEIQYLQNNQIDVVVTDHHKAKNILPNCCICNPNIYEDNNGYYLAGVGVAYKVCQLIDQKLSLNNMINEYLFAVAIGTIADVMPFTNENMALIILGLKQLNDNNCPNTFKIFKNKISKDKLTATDIAWDIAPKLNACGRMGNVEKAASLFYLEQNEEQKIVDTVLSIIEINEERKCFTKKAEKAIEKLNFDNDNVCIFIANDFPSGMFGPIASKIVERFNKPAFVLSGNDILTGSVRSIEGISLQKLLKIELSKNNIINFGGHDIACGIELKSNMINTFRQSINQTITDMIQNNQIVIKTPEISIDAEISLADINKNTFNEINILPYDKNKFTDPIFILTDLKVVDIKFSKNNHNNICLTLKDRQHNVSQIWAWKFGDIYKELDNPDYINIVGTIERDFMNSKKYTLKILDMKAYKETNI